ncbi:GNAT family N-acetyltransferase [Pseudomonas putida]
MQPFSLRELRSGDVEGLLAFERDNRDWFEAHIEARDPAFYSHQGVAAHIEAYLSGLANGTWHAFVIEDAGGAIVGRANLKDIDREGRTAQVGYRVAQAACGQGLATMGLRHLIRKAQARWGLEHLVAHVFAGNVGSRKVLLGCGFVPDATAPHAGEDRFVLPLT